MATNDIDLVVLYMALDQAMRPFQKAICSAFDKIYNITDPDTLAEVPEKLSDLLELAQCVADEVESESK